MLIYPTRTDIIEVRQMSIRAKMDNFLLERREKVEANRKTQYKNIEDMFAQVGW